MNPCGKLGADFRQSVGRQWRWQHAALFISGAMVQWLQIQILNPMVLADDGGGLKWKWPSCSNQGREKLSKWILNEVRGVFVRTCVDAKKKIPEPSTTKPQFHVLALASFFSFFFFFLQVG